MAGGQSLRAKFLQNAAHLLFIPSPTVSKQLLRENSELGLGLSHTGHNSRSPEEACTACGNLLLPGWTTSTKFATKKLKTKKTRDQRSKIEIRRKVRSRRCHCCDRVIKDMSEMISSHDINLRRAAPPLSQPPDATAAAMSTDSAPERSTKTSNKKRAKARKDREGLQALLNRNAQAKSAPSLNLLDLMKK